MLCGRPWTVKKLRLLFTNGIYKGDYAYGKHKVRDGITCPNGNMLGAPTSALVDSEMIEALRRLWKRKGKLSASILHAAKDGPSVRTYPNHFASINAR
jgi:hypothetical protein